MLKHRFAVAAALLAMGPVASIAQDPEAEMRFNTAVRMLRDGLPDKALPEIQGALKKDPNNAFYLKGLGLTYAQLADKCKESDSSCRNNNLKKAVDAAQRALASNPDYVDVRNDLGIALLRLGKRTDGKAELARAFGDPQCPTPEVTAWNLGQAFFEEKEYNEALTWFQAAQRKNKALAAAYLSIAEVFMATSQPEAAILQLEGGLPETSGNPILQLALGDIYVKVGRFQDGRSAYEQVIKKDPMSPAARQAVERLKAFPR
jgi:tetratricopeptide (TPR) repeat protein